MKRAIFVISLLLFTIISAMETDELGSTSLVASTVDELVLKGIKHIKDKGEIFEARAGSGQQAYDVDYILTNPLNRVHTLRKGPALRYFCRELLAYFKGSLQVNEGLAQAAPLWSTLADEKGNICSNYGYYVFHQTVPEFDNKTQYEWALKQLTKNLDSRKAFININQPNHKVETNKDFPCTLGMQFFIRKNKLCCTVSSRSTDIYTGLPYDMGFFALVTELAYKDLQSRISKEKNEKLELGHVAMKTNFTQIYDKTRTSALKLLSNSDMKNYTYQSDMPVIHDAAETMKDIYAQTSHTPIMKWIEKNAQLTK